MQQQRHPPVGEPRRRGPPERLLDADREDGLLPVVLHPHLRPARHPHPFGRELVEAARVGPGQQPAQRGEYVDPAEVPGAADPGELRAEPRLDRRSERVVGHVGPRIAQRPVQEGHPGAQRRGGLGPGQHREALDPQPLTHGGGHQRGRRVGDPLGGQLDRAEPGAAPRDDPAVGPLDLLLLVPQGRRPPRAPGPRRSARRTGWSRRRSPGRGPRRRRPARWPGQGRAARPEHRAGPGGHQVGRRAGTLPGDPSRVRERDDQADREVVGQAALTVVVADRGGQRGPQPPHRGRPARRGGPPRRSGRSAATRSPPGERHVLGEQRDDLGGAAGADHGGPVEQGAGQPWVGRDPGDRPATVRHRAVLAHRPEVGQRGPRDRHGRLRRRVHQGQPRAVRAAPARRARARTTSGPPWRSRAAGARGGGRARPATSSGTPPPGPRGPRAPPAARRPHG